MSYLSKKLRTEFFISVFIIALLSISSAVFAQRYPVGLVDPLSFTLSTNRDGDLELSLDKQPFLTELNSPQSIGWTLRNSGDAPVDCTLTFTGADTVTPIDTDNKPVPSLVKAITVPGKGEVSGTFSYTLLLGTYNAHYPLSILVDYKKEGNDKSLEAVRVVEAKLPQTGKSYQTTEVKIGGVSLLNKSYSASCQILGATKVELGQHWTGTDKNSNATFVPTPATLDGQTRSGFRIHPPYIPGGGSLFLEYPISLSNEPGFHLVYGCGMAPHTPEEPDSDGVTFRIWGKIAGGENELLDEYHTAANNWTDRKVSLEKYAGKKMLLTIEANPGPQNITTCDSCFISGLAINSGKSVSPGEFKEAGKKFLFDLDDGMKAQVELGKLGLLDAKITLGNAQSRVTYNGINLAVGSLQLGDSLSQFTAPPAIHRDNNTKKMTCTYSLLIEDQIVPVMLDVYTLAGMLVIEVPPGNPDRIGQLSLLAADKPLERLFFSHGYVVEKPTKSVMLHGGGHTLATSHVAFEYKNGPAILMSSTMPPDYLAVVPEKNIYTLNVNGITKIGLLPSDQGAYHAAFKYRDRSPWVGSPSSGVARKAGRLVFDAWGGGSADLMKVMDKVFKYGVTDSHFLQHAWQRWGYDVRLPDIWAPDTDIIVAPHAGPIEKLRELAQLCQKYGVPFGLHDNYIDYYPDAENYSYDYITFSEQGQPNRAWINEYAQAQSYQWRPDMFMPFLVKNMELANRYIPELDSYFVDVFTSANIHDFFTRDGQFVSRSVTLDNWKKAFETISEYLSHQDAAGNKIAGITASEAGDDFLIGSLDSADAQWLEIVDQGRDFGLYFPCENSSRTPWFTAVNHTNFVRYGAGYSDRYQSKRSREAHGIMSDDYISSEILGGLCLMVDLGSIDPGSIIKHYLAQHVIRHLSDKQIASVEFVEDGHGDKIRRQKVTWNDGTAVYVNRSDYDWSVQDFVLPLFGYAVFDKSGKFISGIIRNSADLSEVVELSQRDDSFYLNGRGFVKTNVLSFSPSAVSVEILGNGQFKVPVKWEAAGPAPKDLSTFVHVFSAESDYREGWYAGGETPAIPTTKWGIKDNTGDTTIVTTGENQVLTVPQNIKDGVYTVLIGIYDAQGRGQRYRLIGTPNNSLSYGVADIEVKRTGDKVTVTQKPFTPIKSFDHPLMQPRLSANKTLASWNGVQTAGAVTVTPGTNTWKILPIPTTREFPVSIEEKALGKSVKRITCAGKEVPFTTNNGLITFEVIAEDALPYEVELDFPTH